jgi:hypothetical protein
MSWVGSERRTIQSGLYSSYKFQKLSDIQCNLEQSQTGNVTSYNEMSQPLHFTIIVKQQDNHEV